MGSGAYSYAARTTRSQIMGYNTKPREEIFTARRINNAMDPKQAQLRESRDSDEHPNSVAIIIGLDVTGSMGMVPHYLVKDGLPNIIQKIIDNGIADPQVLFLGIGDHNCDRAPLQVGQFESSDELMDKWLTGIWLEGGGGGNYGESYILAWYYAANHTAIDCWEKRKQKGVLITIGDEPLHKMVSSGAMRDIMGHGDCPDITAGEVLALAREKYSVSHINILGGTSRGDDSRTKDDWREILGSDLHMAQTQESVVELIAGLVIKSCKGSAMKEPTLETPAVEHPSIPDSTEEIL